MQHLHYRQPLLKLSFVNIFDMHKDQEIKT